MFRPSVFVVARFNADRYGDLMGSAIENNPATGLEAANPTRVFLGDADGGLSAVADGPWPVGLGVSAAASGDFDNDGRPDYAVASGTATTSHTVHILLNRTPWPATTLSATALDAGGREVNTIGAPQTLTVTNSGAEALTVYSASIGGVDPDDFIETFDSCTGASVPLAGQCSINVRFAPSVEGARTASLRLADNTVAGANAVSLTGIGTSPVPGPTGPAGPARPRRRDRPDRFRWSHRPDRFDGGARAHGGHRSDRDTRRAGSDRRNRAPGPCRGPGSARPERHGDLQAEEGRRPGARHLHGSLRRGREVGGPRPPRARKHGVRDDTAGGRSRTCIDHDAEPWAGATRAATPCCSPS